MGGAKREWEEYIERGWCAPNKMVCQDCVEDEFLKHLISEATSSKRCDYCGKRARRDIAAPVEIIMPAISFALNYFYAEPTAAGVPYDEGWVIQPTYTADALMGIPFDANQDLFEDVERSFENQAWVAAAEGHWASSHSNEDWSYAWSGFTELVKHRSRYFFMLPNKHEENYQPGENSLQILETIASFASSFGLIVNLPTGTRFYRVREREYDAKWEICSEQLGPPPSELAGAGRMNPAGIPYLYLAIELRTAIGEVLRSPPCKAAVGIFEAERDLILLDLSKLPEIPSIFDENRYKEREVILFLNDFVSHISQPVRKDGREHISYVPSQVVSEYFAQVFTTAQGKLLDGIAYPSAVQPGGKNIVLFPSYTFNEDERVKFISGDELFFETWRDLTKTLLA